MADDLKQRLREYELDSEAWLAADRIEQLEAERSYLLKALEDAAFRAAHGECAHVQLICDDAIAKLKR